MQTFNDKAFKASKAALTTSSKTVKKHVQLLIEMGLDHYETTRDAQKLTEVLAHCEGLRSLPNESLKKYIEAHANVRWVVSTKKGVKVKRFKMQGSEPAIQVPAVEWFDHETNKANVARVVDADSMAKALLNKLTAGLQKGNVKDLKRTEELRTAIAGFLNA